MEEEKLSKCCNAKTFQGHPRSFDGREESNVYFCEKCDKECEIVRQVTKPQYEKEEIQMELKETKKNSPRATGL